MSRLPQLSHYRQRVSPSRKIKSQRHTHLLRRDTFEQHATTSAVRHLRASWDNFTDAQSNISAYYVQFFAQPPSHRNRTATAAAAASNGSDVGGGGPVNVTAAGADGSLVIDTAPLDDGGGGGGAPVNLTDIVNVGLANRCVGHLHCCFICCCVPCLQPESRRRGAPETHRHCESGAGKQVCSGDAGFASNGHRPRLLLKHTGCCHEAGADTSPPPTHTGSATPSARSTTACSTTP